MKREILRVLTHGKKGYTAEGNLNCLVWGHAPPEDVSDLGSDLAFNSGFFLQYILINTKESS